MSTEIRDLNTCLVGHEFNLRYQNKTKQTNKQNNLEIKGFFQNIIIKNIKKFFFQYFETKKPQKLKMSENESLW